MLQDSAADAHLERWDERCAMRRRELRVRQVFRQDRMRRRGHERLASDQAGVVRETHIDEPSIWLVAHISICIVVTAIKPGQSQQNKTDMVNLA